MRLNTDYFSAGRIFPRRAVFYNGSYNFGIGKKLLGLGGLALGGAAAMALPAMLGLDGADGDVTSATDAADSKFMPENSVLHNIHSPEKPPLLPQDTWDGLKRMMENSHPKLGIQGGAHTSAVSDKPIFSDSSAADSTHPGKTAAAAEPAADNPKHAAPAAEEKPLKKLVARGPAKHEDVKSVIANAKHHPRMPKIASYPGDKAGLFEKLADSDLDDSAIDRELRKYGYNRKDLVDWIANSDKY